MKLTAWRLSIPLAVFVCLGAVLALALDGELRPDGASRAVKPSPTTGKKLFAPDGTKLDGCSKQSCYSQALGNIAYSNGPKPAIDEAVRLHTTITDGTYNCHDAMHSIGSASLARADGDIGAAFMEGTADCFSGYYHGLLEFSFAGVAASEVGDRVSDLCVDTRITRSHFLEAQCLHGVGHGLMLYLDYDLPGALAACDRLSDAARSDCGGGAIMENNNTLEYEGIESRFLRDDDLLYPCSIVAEHHKEICHLTVGARIANALDLDWNASAVECRKAEARWVNACFQSLGQHASGANQPLAAETYRVCKVMSRHEGECLYGAARNTVSFYGKLDQAVKLCAGASKVHRRRCFEGVGSVHLSMQPDSLLRRQACSRIAPGEFQRQCIHAIA